MCGFLTVFYRNIAPDCAMGYQDHDDDRVTESRKEAPAARHILLRSDTRAPGGG
jgi:hypothetical protein